MKDEKKLRVIFWIDKWSPIVKGSFCYKDLQQLRSKYIYKDISPDEYKRDIQTLKRVKEFVYWSYGK